MNGEILCFFLAIAMAGYFSIFSFDIRILLVMYAILEAIVMKIYKIHLLIFFLVAIFPASVLLLQQSEDLMIVQTDKKIIIDGILDEWSTVKETPVNLFPDGKKLDPSPDLIVTARFTYDSKNFYAAIKAIDDHFEFPNRSWRYGDGLYLTFIDPYEGNESDRFCSFGFSLQDKKKTKVLVNRDGEYFPETSIKDIQLNINADKQKKSIVYEIAIPWEYIIPFKPFIHDKWGINLIYVDRDQDKRKILQLYPDLNYDTEFSRKRKGAIFNFINHIPKNREFQASMNASHFYQDDEKIVTLAVNSPSGDSGWKMIYEISSAFGNISSEKDISMKKGMNLISLSLKNDIKESSLYDLSLGIIDDKGSLKYTSDMQYFLLNRQEFENKNSKLTEVKKEELFSKDMIFRESLPALEIRLEWIKEFMEEAPPFADIRYLNQWHQEASTLLENINEGKPALFLPGRISRLAHRSKIDGTLQPYSVFIPENYDKETPFPLFVTLHGSGVDEQRPMYYMTRMVNYMSIKRNLKRNFIVLAPKARGLSDWYLGDSGKDVIECIDHVKKLYNIDEKNIILDGFSMGGYGAWRLGLLYPDLFKAVIIRSGGISPSASLKGENIIDLLDKGKGLNLFIVHGDKDNAVPVENARKAVQRSKELGIKHIYIEVKGAAHGGYDKWDEIFRWLKTIIGQKR